MIRERLLQAYVLEQAELVRLEVQLRDDDEEGELELEQRWQRLSIVRIRAKLRRTEAGASQASKSPILEEILRWQESVPHTPPEV